jgi:hypothetical protein
MPKETLSTMPQELVYQPLKYNNVFNLWNPLCGLLPEVSSIAGISQRLFVRVGEAGAKGNKVGTRVSKRAFNDNV